MKRISETERLINFGLNASEDALNGAIQSLVAIRNNRFPIEKKTRKRKAKPPEPAEPPPERKLKARAKVATGGTIGDGEPNWLTSHPEPEAEQ